MLRYCWVVPLSNEPKHIYVGPVVTEPIDFLSRTFEFWDIAHYSQAQSGVKATQIVTCPREISSGTEPKSINLFKVSQSLEQANEELNRFGKASYM